MSDVERIKERLSIADVVSSYIRLERAGKNLRAACPFHHEKTPSFYVSPERGSYYCFGCNAKGDIFTFVEEFEGLDFSGALALLAERAGVELTGKRGPGGDEKNRLREAVAEAVRFYKDKLAKNKEALEYLAERGFTPESIEAFGLGYAPDDWRELHDLLLKKGFKAEELVSAGLVKKSEKPARRSLGEGGGAFYDVFRARIVFPINDAAGRPVAFSGRVFPPVSDEEAVGERSAKYLNTPETVLFRKSELLYGYDCAKAAMRKYDFAILVEGTIDVVLSHGAGFPNTVAPLGTALTASHLARIKQLTGNLVLALDADSAGVASATRSAALALAEGFDVKVAALPSGKDPADVIAENSEVWRASVRGAEHIVEFLLGIERERAEGDARALELAVRQSVLPFVARIESAIDRAHFVKRVAEALGIREQAVWEELPKAGADERDARNPRAPASREASRKQQQSRDATRELLVLVLSQKSLKEPDIDVPAVTKELLRLSGTKTLDELISRYDKETLLFEAEKEQERTSAPDRKARELTRRLEIKRLEREKENARTGDMKRFQELSKKIDELKLSMHSS